MIALATAGCQDHLAKPMFAMLARHLSRQLGRILIKPDVRKRPKALVH
jgi:hypothetical protein